MYCATCCVLFACRTFEPQQQQLLDSRCIMPGLTAGCGTILCSMLMLCVCPVLDGVLRADQTALQAFLAGNEHSGFLIG